jgi:hypothetical protein
MTSHVTSIARATTGWFLPVYGWLSILLLGPGAAYSWSRHMWVEAPIVTLFLLYGAWALLTVGHSIEVTDAGVRITCRLGDAYIAWTDVTEVGTDGGVIVLRGLNKRFPVTPLYYRSQECEFVMDAIQAMVDQRDIPVREDRGAMWYLPRNVRAARSVAG